MDVQRMANTRAVLRLQGFVEQSGGCWVGTHYTAKVTDRPTLETERARSVGAKPAYIIEYSACA